MTPQVITEEFLEMSGPAVFLLLWSCAEKALWHSWDLGSFYSWNMLHLLALPDNLYLNDPQWFKTQCWDALLLNSIKTIERLSCIFDVEHFKTSLISRAREMKW